MLLKIKVSSSSKLNGIRCLRAAEAIRKGEIIEECPVILVPVSEMEHVSKTLLRKYEFLWDDSHEAVVLGYGSLYNHSTSPNVSFEHDYVRKLMIYRADRDIEKDEELFIDYQAGDPTDIDPEYIDYKN